MPPPSQPVTHHSSSSVWLSGLVAALTLVLAGCATTDQAAYTAPTSQLYTLRDADAIGALLDRIEAGQSAPGIKDTSTTPDFVSNAMAYLGTRYKYGGTSPATGFDCSGLIWYVFNDLGIDVPRVAAEQAKLGERVARAELERGDLVFFNTAGRRYSHVGIYVGDGKFLHAPRTGGKVRVEAMNKRYWNSRYNGARRVSALTALAVN